MLKIPIDILIVDDEKDFVEMLSLRLEDAGPPGARGLQR